MMKIVFCKYGTNTNEKPITLIIYFKKYNNKFRINKLLIKKKLE